MASTERLSKFKNHGKDLENNRNRRKEDVVELRKARKEEQLSKRRNIHLAEDSSDLDDSDNNNPSSPMANRQNMVAHHDIEALVAGLSSADPDEVLRCTIASRRALSKEKNPPIDKFIRLNAVPKFVKLLESTTDTKLQLEVAWALTNIASGNSEQTECVVQAGACPHFVRYLQSPCRLVSEQAVWALANIAGDGSKYRDMIIGLGVIRPLAQLVAQRDETSFLSNASWCFSNLCRNKDPPPPMHAIQECLPSIKRLLMHDAPSVVSDACWSLSYISDGPDEKIQLVIDLGIIERLLELITTMENRTVVTPSLRVLGNIVTGSDTQTQTAIDRGILPTFRLLLENDRLNLRKEITWALSNITAGNTNQIQAVIDAGLLPHLIELLKNGENKVQKEATWAITNFTCGGNEQQIAHIVQLGCIPPLLNMLNLEDSKIILVVLDAFKNILAAAESSGQKPALVEHLEELGLVDHLERLQNHENNEIYNMTSKLLEDNWETVECDVPVPVAQDGNEYAFEANQNNDTEPKNFMF